MKLKKRIISILLAVCIICSSAAMLGATVQEKPVQPSDLPLIGDANQDGTVNLLDIIAMRKQLALFDNEIDLVQADLDYDYRLTVLDLIYERKLLVKIYTQEDLYRDNTGENNYAKNSDYELVWSDEFNGTNLNTDNWGYEMGYVRNNEPQYYTSRRDNVEVKNGYLRISATTKVSNVSGEMKFYSGSVNTKGKQSFKYGVIEMRAKLPSSKANPTATWPAFWMMGTQSWWPKCGETDILEMYGQNFKKYEANVHWADENGNHVHLWTTDGKLPTYYDSKDLGDTWHTYGVEWTKEYMRFYCDDTTLGTVDITGKDQTELHYPNYILLNLALQPGEIGKANKHSFPIDYLIDYVRVYQKK